MDIVKAKYGIDKNDEARKAPLIMRELLAGIAAKGKKSATLASIVRAIVALREGSPSQDERVAEVVV